ncbi:MAG: hypothetical protein PHZ26_05695 [Candidatus Gracilibacteria bacterium]|nr:hypothetical protein [Candidatus Gracilibacteria bacterium]MDD2909209.1 hypothetical protein [Candidatus Gracilibacteria bacterium]
MKIYLQKFKEGIIFGAGFLIMLFTGIYAYQFTTYVDVPDSSSGSILTSSGYNQLIANVRNLNTRTTTNEASYSNLLTVDLDLDSRVKKVYNTGTTNTKVAYATCSKVNPTLGRVYACDGTDIGASGAADTIFFTCNTGYKVISGGYGVPNFTTILRVSMADSRSRWGFTSNGAIGQIGILCMKVE